LAGRVGPERVGGIIPQGGWTGMRKMVALRPRRPGQAVVCQSSANLIWQRYADPALALALRIRQAWDIALRHS